MNAIRQYSQYVTSNVGTLPRGWVIVALAIAAWGLVIATAWAFNAVWQVLLG
jgi:hypothetical protein